MRARTLFSALFVAGLAASCSRPAQAPIAQQAAPADDALATVAKLDAVLAEAWKQAGITPALDADDATFVRRAYLDLTGAIPRPADVLRFAADKRPSRRDALVRELLASPGYALHWTNVLDELLMGSPARSRPRIDRIEFRRWLHGELSRDAGWDQMAREMIAGTGATSAGGKPDLTDWDLDKPAAAARESGVNGAVNFFVAYYQPPSMLTGKVAKVFLGVPLQCAECHDHPDQPYKQEDFRRFTAAFMRTRVENKAKMTPNPPLAVSDIEFSGKNAHKKDERYAERKRKQTGYDDQDPTALDGTSLEPRPRQQLAAWLTSPQNRWFARAMVNRVWAQLTGRPFVHPLDGLGRDDPARGAQVASALNLLADDFAGHGFSLRRLIRVVCASSAYQRATEALPEGASAGATTPASEALWSRFRPRAMSAAQLLDSLAVASNIEPVLSEIAGAKFPNLKLAVRRQFSFTFDVDDDSGVDDTFTGTVPQALMLLNGPLAAGASAALAGSTVGAVARDYQDDADKISALYRAALSREPTNAELTRWLDYLDAAPRKLDKRWPGSAGSGPGSSPHSLQAARGGPGSGAIEGAYRRLRIPGYSGKDQALEDLFWTLLNSSEFFFIH